jgi:hypothetical protein
MFFTVATTFSFATSLTLRRAGLPSSSLMRFLSRLQYLRARERASEASAKEE